MSFFRAARSIISRPVVFFTTSRYVSYALLFLRGILIAKILGPYFFGIWGFITLYQQYIGFTSMGVQYAVNTELSLLDATNLKKRDSLINASFSVTIVIFLILLSVALILRMMETDIFKVAGSYQFIILTFLIGALQHFRELFANIFRVFNDYWRISVGELLVASITVAVVFLFRDENLITALLISWAISQCVSILMFIIKAPFKLQFTLDKTAVKILFSIGLPLLIYNVGYYLMTLSSRTIISIFYDMEIVGYFTFAYTITNAILLGLNAASWVFYPVILSKLKIGTAQNELRTTINRVNNLYGVAVVLIVYISILVSPICYIFLEQYRPASAALNVLLLSQAVLSLSFVFNTLVIAQKKHNTLALISMASTALSAGLCLLFASLKMPFAWLAVATLAGFTLYTVAICSFGLRLLKIESFRLIQFFPVSLQLSFVLFFIGIFSPYSLAFYLSGLIIFIWANHTNLKQILDFILKREPSKPTRTDVV